MPPKGHKQIDGAGGGRPKGLTADARAKSLYIGKIGSINCDGMTFPVLITGASFNFGRVDVDVTPMTGTGTARVQLARLHFREGQPPEVPTEATAAPEPVQAAAEPHDAPDEWRAQEPAPTPPPADDCPRCGGWGQIDPSFDAEPGTQPEPCATCNGSGKLEPQMAAMVDALHDVCAEIVQEQADANRVQPVAEPAPVPVLTPVTSKLCTCGNRNPVPLGTRCPWCASLANP